MVLSLLRGLFFSLSLLTLALANEGNQHLFEIKAQLPSGEAEGLYHGVYPGGRTGEEDDILATDLNSYEQAVGRKVAWVYFSNNWYRSRAFPLETAGWIRERGALPYIRLMLRSSIETSQKESLYTLSAILQGDFDDDLRAWATAAAAFASPLLVEYGTEVNGSWFPWNAHWNGKQEGARLFREAYRHIILTMREAGASNILWVFHVDSYDDPETPWNRLEHYYPGDDFIDFLGISAYGVQSPLDSEWASFSESLDHVIPRLSKLAPTKAIFVVEFGSSLHPKLSAAAWADEALAGLLSNRWPEVKGFSWWNETWQNDNNPSHDSDFRVQAVAGLAEVFRKHLSSATIIDHP